MENEQNQHKDESDKEIDGEDYVANESKDFFLVVDVGERVDGLYVHEESYDG
jgi:hypothetical protein